jgi:hypothetical protein
MSWVASAWASIACSGARPFSKRAPASERRLSRPIVRLTFGPSQEAASMSTRVVPGSTSDRCPPMTPAMDVGPSASAMTQVSSSSARSTSSSVCIASPGVPRRTVRRPPAIRSRSKAWTGWPVSSIT